MTLALLADYYNVTREGKINVMGVFTTINAPTLPWVHPQMQLVLELEASPAEWDTTKHIEVKILDVDAKIVVRVEGTTKVPRGEPGKRVRLNTSLTFGNIQFNAKGDYVVAVLVGGETKKEVPFSVNYVPKAALPAKG